jgi:hypothetical protein
MGLSTRLPILGAFLSGIGLGWLVALSRSSILAIVVPTLFATAVGAVSVLQIAHASRDEKPAEASPLLPLGLLILGVALGSSLGALAIAHAWFAPRPASFMALADDLPDQTLKRKYLELSIGPLAAANAVVQPLQAGEVGETMSPRCDRVRQIAIDASAGIDDPTLFRLRNLVNGDAKLQGLLDTTAREQLRQRLLDYCR